MKHSCPPHAGFFTPENMTQFQITTDIRNYQLAEYQREARAQRRIFEPLKSSDFAPVLRPGALDHEKYGSRQADGSVKPCTGTLLGCVGFLKDKTSNARD